MDSIRNWAVVVKQLGIPGFLTLMIVALIAFGADAEQRKELINTWFLLSPTDGKPIIFIIVPFMLICVIFLLVAHYKLQIKQLTKHNKTLEKQIDAITKQMTQKK